MILLACLVPFSSTGVYAVGLIGSQYVQVDSVDLTHVEAPVMAPVIDTKWRYTRYGWQKPGDWIRTSSDVAARTIDRINPILWAVNVLLAALGAMIWASEEWQVARLLGHKKVSGRCQGVEDSEL